MPAAALALTLTAALLHAFWNLLMARAKDPEAASAVALLVALIAYAPVAALTWRLDGQVGPLSRRDRVPPARVRRLPRCCLPACRALARVSDRAGNRAGARAPRRSDRARDRHLGAAGGGRVPRRRRRPARAGTPQGLRSRGCRARARHRVLHRLLHPRGQVRDPLRGAVRLPRALHADFRTGVLGGSRAATRLEQPARRARPGDNCDRAWPPSPPTASSWPRFNAPQRLRWPQCGRPASSSPLPSPPSSSRKRSGPDGSPARSLWRAA